MPETRSTYTYMCAFAHYTGRSLAIGTERREFNRPITPTDVNALNTELRNRGFQQAMVISFSPFGPSQN